MAYSPASVTTSIGNYPTVFYDKVAVANFKANLPFYAATDRRQMPMRAGKVVQVFSYNLLAANTTPGTEGTVGTGITPAASTTQITLNQYFDFESFSDFLVDTTIDDVVSNQAAELGYRAALTINNLTSTAFETAVGSDASAAINLGDNEFMNAAVARQMVMSLRGKDVRPKDDGMFAGIIHPFVAFDLIADNSAGGVIDVLKYTDNGADQLQRGIQGFRVIQLAGINFIETTTVPTYTNFPSSGKTGYATYVVGKDAIISVALDKTQIPGEKNFRLEINNWRPSSADPAGVVGASVAYNMRYGVAQRPGSVMALRRVKSEASIS